LVNSKNKYTGRSYRIIKYDEPVSMGFYLWSVYQEVVIPNNDNDNNTVYLERDGKVYAMKTDWLEIWLDEKVEK
jgi:hypothetical protein